MEGITNFQVSVVTHSPLPTSGGSTLPPLTPPPLHRSPDALHMSTIQAQEDSTWSSTASPAPEGVSGGAPGVHPGGRWGAPPSPDPGGQEPLRAGWTRPRALLLRTGAQPWQCVTSDVQYYMLKYCKAEYSTGIQCRTVHCNLVAQGRMVLNQCRNVAQRAGTGLGN